MDNIVQNVYDALKADTEDIGKIVVRRDELEDAIKSGKYTPQALRDEIYPERDNLRGQVAGKREAAINKAKALVQQYRKDSEKLNDLNPADITDDIKLLQSGVTLRERDIVSILDRNAGNRTMLQLAMRYAEDHGIDMHGRYYIGGQQEQRTADNLDTLIDYYSRWIDKRNAVEMLDKFFGL